MGVAATLAGAKKVYKIGKKCHIVQNAQNENTENSQKDEGGRCLFGSVFTKRLHFCDLTIPISKK